MITAHGTTYATIADAEARIAELRADNERIGASDGRVTEILLIEDAILRSLNTLSTEIVVAPAPAKTSRVLRWTVTRTHRIDVTREGAHTVEADGPSGRHYTLQRSYLGYRRYRLPGQRVDRSESLGGKGGYAWLVLVGDVPVETVNTLPAAKAAAEALEKAALS